jgi:hypothetical protein
MERETGQAMEMAAVKTAMAKHLGEVLGRRF